MKAKRGNGAYALLGIVSAVAFVLGAILVFLALVEFLDIEPGLRLYLAILVPVVFLYVVRRFLFREGVRSE